jgi:putative membrane protein
MKVYLACATALMVIGSAATAETVSPSQFVAKAGASDRFEIESARLMVPSSDPGITTFATQMITDHTESTKMVTTAAEADHLTLKKPSLTVAQRADLTALKGVPAGKAKDDLYIKQQKTAHADALALMQGYASDGTARHLKMTAGKIAPVVQKHQSMLATM